MEDITNSLIGDKKISVGVNFREKSTFFEENCIFLYLISVFVCL